jgi:hypothetical protein
MAALALKDATELVGQKVKMDQADAFQNIGKRVE